MGLEALPARWNLLSISSSRRSPFFSLDVGADVSSSSRNFLTRRSSDSSSSESSGPRGSSRSSSTRRVPFSPTASVDGVPGFPSRGPWSEKASKGGPSSSSLRSESSWSHQGFPEQSGPSGYFRWKLDGAGSIRRATRLEDFAGDRWRRREDGSSEVEKFCQGFERLEVDVADSSTQGVGEAAGRAWFRSESTRFEARGAGDRDHGHRSGPAAAAAESSASAVDVTAPSFVRDRKFAERRDHYHQPRGGGEVTQRVDMSLIDSRPEGMSDAIGRPASLKRKAARVCSSQHEAQGRSASRAGENAPVVSAAAAPVPAIPMGLGGRADCLSIPDSLQRLKKRNERGRMRASVCPIKKAFDSMVFMIRALQSYTLQMRKVLFSDTDVQHLLSLVHREMHSSFLWLFQQVFSCTPTLMVSVMILLANFTIFSLGNNVAMAGGISQPGPSNQLVSMLQTRTDPSQTFGTQNGFTFVHVDRSLDSPSPADVDSFAAGHGFGNYGPGGIGGRSVIVAGGEDGDFDARRASDRNAMFSEKESNSIDLQSASLRGNLKENLGPVFRPSFRDASKRRDDGTVGRSWTSSTQQPVKQESEANRDDRAYRALLEQAARELELKPGEPYHHVELDQETLRRLVAPVFTKMESDDYLCFDRTDLEYQHAINAEPANPMLLANYAQFLYAVRHNNQRAEVFFSRALSAESEDGDILGRWASFLWLALKDRPRAEKAYKAAIALDPSNPFHAGSYAHFLWHGDEDDSSCCRADSSF